MHLYRAREAGEGASFFLTQQEPYRNSLAYPKLVSKRGSQGSEFLHLHESPGYSLHHDFCSAYMNFTNDTVGFLLLLFSFVCFCSCIQVKENCKDHHIIFFNSSFYIVLWWVWSTLITETVIPILLWLGGLFTQLWWWAHTCLSLGTILIELWI